MPETQQLKALDASRTELADRARDLQIRVDDLTREQKKADADVEQVKGRRQRDQDRMDQGLVANPKDLARMQQELVSLERRIGELEDAELEVMEHLETVQAELADVHRRVAELDKQRAELAASRDDKAARVDEQLTAVAQERKTTASGLPEDLMTLYTKLRTQKGGVGVGALRARSCSGCGLDVSGADLAVIAKAPSDEVLRCEECNRILVRTPESGI